MSEPRIPEISRVGETLRSGVTRRQVLKTGLAAVVGAPLLRAAPRTRRPRAPRDLVRRVLPTDPRAYCGWPTVARTAGGDLLVAWSGGREAHVCPFGRVESMRSRDRGQSFDEPRVLFDGPIDDRDCGVTVTAKGTILVTTFTSLAYEATLEQGRKARNTEQAWDPERLAHWERVQARTTDAARRSALAVLALRSTDDGLSFSAPVDTLVNSPHGPIALQDGRLLYAGKDLWRSEKNGFAESSDDGATWRWTAELPTRGGDDFRQYHELHAVECQSGKLLVHVRNHNERNAREILQAQSLDGGRTWSEPEATSVWGLPSHLLRLADGRILMSYGYRRAPFGVHVRLSEDEGASWSEPIVLSDDGAGVDLGYPSTVQHDDGTLFTLWYERLATSPFAVLRCADWEL